MPRGLRTSDRVILSMAKMLSRDGTWQDPRTGTVFKVRSTRGAATKGRPRKGELGLVEILAIRTGYATRTIRRILAQQPRGGSTSRLPPQPPSAPPRVIESHLASGLAAVGLRMEPLERATAPATHADPPALLRQALAENLDAALATPGALPEDLRAQAADFLAKLHRS